MAKVFAIGDNVEFPYWAGVEKGVIEKIDREAGSMWIRTSQRIIHSAKWVSGYWLAYRGYKVYRGRVRRMN